VTAALADAVFIAFLIFCRIGSCLMLVPGYSSARVPMQVRLLIAAAVSLALTPLLFAPAAATLVAVDAGRRPFLLVSETIAGATIGLMARFYLLGLQFAATVTASAIGLAGIPGQPIDDTEAAPPLATLLSLAGVMVLLAAGLHVEMLRAIFDSYRAVPVRLEVDTGWLLDTVTKVVTDSSMMALRLSGPFVVYAVVVNTAMGLANKFTPQVSIYFASLGLVTAGGLVIMFFIAPEWLTVFRDSYEAWLSGGAG
jgi:flagellar biosynthesis protein FliR